MRTCIRDFRPSLVGQLETAAYAESPAALAAKQPPRRPTCAGLGPKAARRANRKAGTQNRRSHQAAVRGNCSESRRPWVYSTEERGATSDAYRIDQRRGGLATAPGERLRLPCL